MPHVFWLRLQLAASASIDDAMSIACFGLLACFVLTDEAIRHLNLSLL